MNDELRGLHQKLLLILHKACSEIRTFVRIGEQQRVYDLADTVEFIPELMLSWRPESRRSIESALRRYQDKYPGSGFDYLSVLAMADSDFHRWYLEIKPADVTA
jgi:hypothetical protein